MKKNNSVILSKNKRRILLILIILFAVVRLIYLFNLRDGHHVDEAWSYIHANCYDEIDFFSRDDDPSKRVNTWLNSDFFRGFITVSDDHRFSFDSVLHNTEYDLSPPLYPLILHFICSLFPNTFSWWYAFSINLITYIPSLVLIYLIIYSFTDSYLCSFVGLIYYIFSGCGTADFLYLRVYHLFTLFTLALFYFFQMYFKEKGNKRVILYIMLPLFTFLGAYNHYYFLVIAFAYTLFSSLVLFVRRRFKDAFMVCLIMLLSVVFFFSVYKPALSQLIPIVGGNTTATGYYDYPYNFDLINANIRFFMDTIGFYINFNVPGLIYFIGIVAFISIIILLIVFVFRNENWMKSLMKETRHFVKQFINALISFSKKFDLTILVALFSCVFYLLVIPITAPLTNMGYIERYFFPVMSLFLTVYLSFAGMLLKTIICNGTSVKEMNKKQMLIALLLFVVIVIQNYRSSSLINDFRFLGMKEKEMSVAVADKDIYAIVYAERDLIWLCPVLLDSNNIYFSYEENFVEDEYEIPDIDPDCMVLLLDTGLITEEQKSELLENDTFSFTGLFKPKYLYTINDFISEISASTGTSIRYVDDYPAFIGHILLYEQTSKEDE